MKKSFWKIAQKVVKQAVSRFKEADPIVYSAAIAFFTIFSLPPILLIILWVAGAVIDPDAIREEVYDQAAEAIGEESAEQIEMLLDQGRQLGDNVLGNIITIAVLVFVATVMITFLKKGLNSIWGIKPKPAKGLLKFALDRLLSLLLIILLGALVIASLMVNAFIGYLGDALSDTLFGMASYVTWVINIALSYILVTGAFALLFKYLPDIKIDWRPIWFGASITGALFILGEYVIGVIINQTNVGSTYGAAGSLAAIMLWVFYSSVIILVGALITKIHLLHSGNTIRPRKGAVAVETKEIERKELKE